MQRVPRTPLSNRAQSKMANKKADEFNVGHEGWEGKRNFRKETEHVSASTLAKPTFVFVPTPYVGGSTNLKYHPTTKTHR